MKSRFRPRFSLRTLLLIFTVFAVWLGLIVSRAKKQKVAVDTITKLGGSVYYDYHIHKQGTKLTVPGGRSVDEFGSIMTWGPGTITIGNERNSYLVGQALATPSPVPKWLSRLVGEEMFVKVIAVHLNDQRLTDGDMQCLEGLPDIRVLKLSGTSITDQALVHMSGLRKLEELTLNGTSIEGPGLAHLQHLPRLEDLELSGTRITDDGLDQIAAPQSLSTINLDSTSVSDAGLAYLQHANRLTVVSLLHTNVRGPGLRHLNGARIEVLLLAHTPVEEEGLSCLAEWPNLRELWLEHSSLNDAGLERLKTLTHLKTLRLSWVAHRSSNISVDAARRIEQALPNTEVVYPP